MRQGAFRVRDGDEVLPGFLFRQRGGNVIVEVFK
jgi:hypothetical protein